MKITYNMKITYFNMLYKKPILNHFSLVVYIFLLLAAYQEAEAQDKRRPNIIFIMSDDHAYQAISAYDNKLIKTPNIDRIAKMGMLFTNASVTNSICAPSRATILTGKHSHLHGKVDNHLVLKDLTSIRFFLDRGFTTILNL
jgi:arylsulfatase A-like enzyme